MNIPKSTLKRVVIIGAGFGGLQIAKNLIRNKYSGMSLLYQIATSERAADSSCS